MPQISLRIPPKAPSWVKVPLNALQCLAHEPFNCTMWSLGLFEILGILNFLSIECHIIAYLKGDILPSSLSTLSRTHKVSSLRKTSYIEIVAGGAHLVNICVQRSFANYFSSQTAMCTWCRRSGKSIFRHIIFTVMIVVVIAVIIRECGRCGSWGKRVLADTFWLSPATLYSIQHCSASPIVDNWWSSWSSLLPVIIIND